MIETIQREIKNLWLHISTYAFTFRRIVIVAIWRINV